ncbi:MAG: peptidylprolyl isomerase [Pseudomonadota bacterium]
MSSIKYHLSISLCASLFCLSSLTQANPVACFNTNMGDFCLELFERQAPKTVANFIRYIDSSAYTNGIFHRSVPDFVIQGGGFKIVTSSGKSTLTTVSTFDPVVNEFKTSNTRGTVAMAKLGNDPDSATSQWFVNLADNSANLDQQNGGFTVFGRVLYNGMTVMDAIEKLPVNNLGGSLTAAPTINFNGTELLISNLVQISSVSVENVAGIFNDNVLSFAVETGSNTYFDVRLLLVSVDPNIVFELDPASIVPLQEKPAHPAVYSAQDGTLTIPSVMTGNATVVNNVLMTLTNADSFRFTVSSMTQP